MSFLEHFHKDLTLWKNTQWHADKPVLSLQALRHVFVCKRVEQLYLKEAHLSGTGV